MIINYGPLWYLLYDVIGYGGMPMPYDVVLDGDETVSLRGVYRDSVGATTYMKFTWVFEVRDKVPGPPEYESLMVKIGLHTGNVTWSGSSAWSQEDEEDLSFEGRDDWVEAHRKLGSRRGVWYDWWSKRRFKPLHLKMIRKFLDTYGDH